MGGQSQRRNGVQKTHSLYSAHKNDGQPQDADLRPPPPGRPPEVYGSLGAGTLASLAEPLASLAPLFSSPLCVAEVQRAAADVRSAADVCSESCDADTTRSDATVDILPLLERAVDPARRQLIEHAAPAPHDADTAAAEMVRKQNEDLEPKDRKRTNGHTYRCRTQCPALKAALAAASVGAELRTNYQMDAHGTSVSLLCPSAPASSCQLNAHVIFMVAPELFLDETQVGAKFSVDGSGWASLAAETEYMFWSASDPRITTGRLSRQYKGWPQSTVLGGSDRNISTFCARAWETDLVNGDRGELGVVCLDIVKQTVSTPQLPALDARVNHAASTYYCAADDCLFNAHIIVSTYAVDPTHDVFGGGLMRLDGGNWTGRGLRVRNQTKPSKFKLWAEDAATREIVDVVANDDGASLPPPTAPGVWCYGTVETLF
ncbi:hypothetical protein M885DRAFT_561376 [Pelagophyceae sp. CCMP2097]|nr:hypothetical protein M885DRAFT_561376 [Pelagophyceae sp. CCMP2097]